MPCRYDETIQETKIRTDNSAASARTKKQLDLLTKGLCTAMRYMEKNKQLDQFDSETVAWFNDHKARDEKRRIKEHGPKQLEKYMKTYAGSRLKYNMDEVGLWRVRGEDPNCDFSGPHHMPEIGIVEGTFKDALLWAVVQDKFWQWGGGGDLTRVNNIRKV